MKIFLTGGTGFIGNALLKALLERSHFVRVLVRNENQKNELEALGAEAVVGNLRNVKKEWLQNIDAVYHLGAIRYEWGFSRDEYRNINIEATEKLIQFSAKCNVEHFIYGSTVFVFGSPANFPIDETFPYAPESEYARSKMEAEKIIQNFNQEPSFKRTIIRPTVTYGPGDTKGMLIKLCRLIKSGKFIMIGSGKNNLHLSHIDDVVQGFLKALENQNKYSDYIIASEKPILLKDLVEQISQELGRKIWPGKIPVTLAKVAGIFFEFAYQTGQEMGIRYFWNEPLITRSKVNILTGNRTYAIKKARAELNFQPQKEIFEEIKNTIHWYQKNGCL